MSCRNVTQIEVVALSCSPTAVITTCSVRFGSTPENHIVIEPHCVSIDISARDTSSIVIVAGHCHGIYAGVIWGWIVRGGRRCYIKSFPGGYAGFFNCHVVEFRAIIEFNTISRSVADIAFYTGITGRAVGCRMASPDAIRFNVTNYAPFSGVITVGAA
jgi:hypothetical protein